MGSCQKRSSSFWWLLVLAGEPHAFGEQVGERQLDQPVGERIRFPQIARHAPHARLAHRREIAAHVLGERRQFSSSLSIVSPADSRIGVGAAAAGGLKFSASTCPIAPRNRETKP
jgi:hypothetical protein